MRNKIKTIRAVYLFVEQYVILNSNDSYRMYLRTSYYS